MNGRRPNWTLLLILAAGAWLYVAGPVVPTPGPPPTPSPSPSSLRTAVTDARDAKRLSDFYGQFAAAIERDSSVVKTTGVFRTARTNATLVAFQGTDLAGKYNLTAEIDRRITAALGGMQDVPLDVAKRAALVVTLRQISTELAN